MIVQLFEGIGSGTSIMIFVTIMLIILSSWSIQRPKNMPPGPIAWPFIGNIPTELMTDNYKDIVFSDYSPIWKLHRKLASAAIRNYASGSHLEKLVDGIKPKLDAALSEKGNSAFDPKLIIGYGVYNILASMCFGIEYDFDDPDFKKLMNMLENITDVFGEGLMADYIPGLRHIPTPGLRNVQNLFSEYLAMIRKEFKRHQDNFNPDEIKDLTDFVLAAQQEAVEEGNDNIADLSDDYLVQTLSDIFGAGSDTTTTTLLWSIATLVDHPDVQAKVQAEIDEVIGRTRSTNLNDRGSLPYTQATIYEIMRYGIVAPVAVPHRTISECTFGSYRIPQDTWVLINLYAVHNDERHWEDPHEFRPERFLSDEKCQVERPDSFLPFSAGRRVCLGESLAKSEIFLIFTWLFQTFMFVKPTDMENVKTAEPQADSGLIHIPKPYKVLVEKRF
ncbi:steroid 17-alpha-hydroxylase/17,20 lyase-like isoform X2 [Anneissia japonica]|uniref:steroid 17-alpha-hydroxylase/17,20 lyase-like isoform X2 n=1 Tax=Anneissia japonica TaxID=1529436 RepID=UPI001425AFE0|nr:steroid 17-alpha-hydroxylase/17,20 lyase-like isoform X2 [Anneissia japonica]